MKKEYKQIKKFQIQIKEKEGILNLNNANNILMTFFIKYFFCFLFNFLRIKFQIIIILFL